MDDLIGEFVSETREMLERVGEALLAWEAQPDDASRLDEIFRFVHTIKGSCGFLNLPRIEALAHGAESALAEVRDGTRVSGRALTEAMLAVIDRIVQLVDALDPENPGAEIGADDGALIDALSGERPAVPHQETPPVAAAIAQVRSIRIGVPLLEKLMDQVSELVLVRNELMRRVRDSDIETVLGGSLDRLSTIVGDLRESVTRTRMQPIEKLFSVLPRLVRDTAAELDKQVTLEIVGQDVEIDREMVEAIRDPLIHIVRNAIDHGIESPAGRLAVGKPPSGRIRVIAAQSGNQVSIEISDDGRGIDVARLKAKAVAAGVTDVARVSALGDSAAISLVFEPGLSTRSEVSTISGRGVGMDIVRANVERLGGSVNLANRPGAGLSITLRAPLTLSIVTGLVVSAGGQPFAIPRSAIEEVVAIGAATRFEPVGDQLVAHLRGTLLPAFVLAATLGLGGERPLLAVVIGTPDGRRFALGIDAIVGEDELVVRPTAPLLAGLGLFAGQALSDNGQPVIVLDPIGLANHVGLDRAIMPPAPQEQADLAQTEQHGVVLATALDGSGIAVRSVLVERVVDIDRRDWIVSGDTVLAVLDGVHIGARLIGALPDDGKVRALLVSDGRRTVAVPVRSVSDVVPVSDLTPIDDARCEGMLRSYDGSYQLLDGFWMFGCAVAEQPKSRPIARVALDPGPWTTGLLAPMLEAAGYAVRFDDRGDADLVIHVEGDTAGHGPAARPIPLLRGDNGGVATEFYDRASLARLIAGAIR